jgi:prephenate dehydratase/chorismate mutase/prephenate dehydratase
MRVAFQGELGAFSEDAVRSFFGERAEPVPRREFRDVGQAVSCGDVDFGALPVENTLVGGVGPSYDVLARERLSVVGEVVVPIHHCVLGIAGTTLKTVRRVLSHPVALAQAVRFFEAHPDIEAIAVYDTAGAAREVVKQADAHTAALASERAAARYGLTVVARNVEDRPDNQTRFLIVAPEGTTFAQVPRESTAPAVLLPTGGERWKTTVLLETADTPGALVRALQCFAHRGINLSKVESRPADVPWTYRFFLEFDTQAESPAAREAISDLETHAASVRVLGSYPKAAASPG